MLNKNYQIKFDKYLHSDEYYYSIVRKNIRKIRLEKKITQEKLAEYVDLSREYICDIENEKRNKHPSLAVIGRISDALGINIIKLFEE